MIAYRLPSFIQTKAFFSYSLLTHIQTNKEREREREHSVYVIVTHVLRISYTLSHTLKWATVYLKKFYEQLQLDRLFFLFDFCGFQFIADETEEEKLKKKSITNDQKITVESQSFYFNAVYMWNTRVLFWHSVYYTLYIWVASKKIVRHRER